MTTTRTDWPTPEERLAALHDKLVSAVEDLASSEAWMRMLQVAARFPDYSSGGEGIFERREFSPTCANPAIEMLWAQSGAYIAVGTLAGVSDLDAAT